MLVRRKTLHKIQNQPADQTIDHLESEIPLLIPQPSDTEYGESFLTAVSSSLAERGYQEYLGETTSTIKSSNNKVPSTVFGNNLITPSSSLGSLCTAEQYHSARQIFSGPDEMHARPSSYFSNTGKRPETPPESPRASLKMGNEYKGWQNDSIEKSIRRQHSAASQVSQLSRGLSKRKAGRMPSESSVEGFKDGMALERVDTTLSQVSSIRSGEFVRSYNIPNAIVAPAFRLARVVSIPHIDEGSALSTPMPFPIRTPSIPEHSFGSLPPVNSIVPVQKIKVSRSIRSFFKGGIQSVISEFDDNSSEEGDRSVKGSKKSMFNLRRPRGRESEDLVRSVPEPCSHPTLQIPPPLPPSSCTRWCGVPRCFHDYDVLHIKNVAGHDCLVIEIVNGTPTVIAGTVEGLMMELCAPISDKSDPTFTDRFLRTCGNFCSPLLILEMLTEYHEKNFDLAYRRRVIEIIIRWLRIQPEDLFEGDKLSPVLTTFVKELNQHGYQPWNQELQSTCEKVSKKVESYQELCKSRELYCLDTLVEEAVLSRESKIMDIDMEDLAKYVAALDLILFRDASENRTVRAWSRRSTDSDLKTSEDHVLNERVDRVLRRAEMIRDWVSFEILAAAPDLTVLYIEKFISLAKMLYDLGNFQSSLSIVDALTADEIGNLTDLWEGISNEKFDTLEELKALNTDQGYAKALSEACVPVVPCLSRFLDHVDKTSAGMFYLRDGTKKNHMDLTIDKCGYTHFPGPSSFCTPGSNQLPHLLYDITKHGLFYHQIHLARQKAWRAHNFDRLSRQAWVFSMHVPGRSAFCRTTLGEKPKRDSNLTQESITPKHSMIQSRQNSVKGEWNFPPSPPTTPPTSTYFESKRISSINGPGGLDWISEPVERRIIEVRSMQSKRT
ncbi:ras guanine nucleotide exchange factor domain-containing protein [Terfezia claveryi]|nr:ras guanine nucleotide exchange factor domain-containing protein [Terfezia claveryi]